jgi:large conductance mechanosensitive channel
MVGDFINAIVSFVLVAAAIYYFVVLPMGAVTSRMKPKTDDAPVLKECPACLSEIPAAARRCKFCTTDLPATA